MFNALNTVAVEPDFEKRVLQTQPLAHRSGDDDGKRRLADVGDDERQRGHEQRACRIALRDEHKPDKAKHVGYDDNADCGGDIAQDAAIRSSGDAGSQHRRNGGTCEKPEKKAPSGAEKFAQASGHAGEDRQADCPHEQVDADDEYRLPWRAEQRDEYDDGGLQGEGDGA